MSKLKILIVDDEVDYCLIMKSYFHDKGYDVHLAYTLKEGLEKIDEIQPDILFLDNNLPDGKGWPHVEIIGEKIPSMKIFLISAYHQRGEFSDNKSNITVWEKPLTLGLLNDTF
jgi:two-component system, OmpR family, response regulator